MINHDKCDAFQKRIDELVTENKKLREALELIEMANCYTDYEDAVNIAREALKEVEEL